MAIAFNNQNNSIGIGSIYSSGFTTSIAINNTGVGIGTTNPTSKLWVNGDGYFTGILTANRIFSSTYGEFVGGNVSGNDIVGTALSISGISTLGTVEISSGIITATTGIVTYYGDGSKLSNIISGVSISTNTTNQAQYLTYVTGTGSTTGFGVTTTGLVFNPSFNSLGIGTTNPTSKLWVNGDGYFTGILTANRIFSNIYGEFVGGNVSGNDIVGTALSISGISTFGGSNGVVIKYENGVGVVTSANSGVTTVTYYGDGSQLTGVTGTQIVTQGLISVPVYPTFANNTGVTSLGIAPDNFVYIPSTGKVGLGSTNPSFNLDITGDARIRTTSKLRFGGTGAASNFYIQYNSTTNSLDFVAG